MWPLVAMAAAQGLSSGISGYMSSNAAEKAASQQAAAQRAALAFQSGVYKDSKANLNPYIQSGTKNLGTYQNLLDTNTQPTLNYTQDDFSFDKWSDPGAQYQMDQASQAMEASALAKGATGGGFAKALQTNRSNLANTAHSSAYDRWLNNSKLKYGQASDQYTRDYTAQQGTLDRYGNLANQGLSAGNALAGFGNQAASTMGGLYSGLGSAQAAGTLGSNNALVSGLQGVMGGLSSGLGAYYGGQSGQTNPYASLAGTRIA